jgi:hypothetical protein
VRGEERVKITDFGLARMAGEVGLTREGTVVGTPEYMAPEQARGDPINHRADLFSLGSVLYTLCTGQPPFPGSTAVAVLHKVGKARAARVRERNPGVPAWLDKLIARLLAKDPDRRLQTAAEVAALLKGYLDHLHQPSLVPAPQLPSLRHAARRRPSARLPVSLAAGFLLCVALTVLGLSDVFWSADLLPDASADLAPGGAPESQPWSWLAAVGVLGLLVLSVLGACLAVRHRRRAENLPAPAGDPPGEVKPEGAPVFFPCPCGKRLKAAGKFAGKKLKCPGCGNVLQVPGGEAGESAPAP